MKNELITENVWQHLTEKVKTTKGKMYVAVAYFGQDAAKMLPLNKGSILLVDASEKAVKCGQTCPEELLKLYAKGVFIYSLPYLHTKMYVLGKTLLVGSANVSYNSSNRLFETLLSTADTKAIHDAKEFILNHCGADLGEEELTRLHKIYKPPKIETSDREKTKKTSIKNILNEKLYVCKLVRKGKWTDDENKAAEQGSREANTKRIETKRHRIDTFRWHGKMTMKKFDEILQITKEGNGSTVCPPGRLIHTKKYTKNGRNITFCYLEVPEKENIPLSKIKSKLSQEDFNRFYRRGYKNFDMAKVIYSWWR